MLPPNAAKAYLIPAAVEGRIAASWNEDYAQTKPLTSARCSSLGPEPTNGCVSSWEKKRRNQATLTGTFGPPVTPTCLTRTARSTNKP
ncbi:hypothetical protein Y032_0010g1011 [Ancylostoma ceylanicum]|uniref:Uncharacterized protein n=1 Tax=Ancylostoma ceylanicum TaxID=53326 RepID=A0A016VFY1_9BILA|nr:hypothetical protein Y032_0010g1011 [Ancylostoma ceylanicum]